MLGIILTELAKIQDDITISEVPGHIAHQQFAIFSDSIDRSEGVADERDCYLAGFKAGYELSHNRVRAGVVRTMADMTAWLMAVMTWLNPHEAEVGAAISDASRDLIAKYAQDRASRNRRAHHYASSVHAPTCKCTVCQFNG